ncbi:MULTISPECIES: hypothetical protein [Nitrosomonas]|nr:MULTISPECIES: hypothetical protein [Nitrosomonas]UVS61999.1 hypothetical protein NX761_02380 [Nitrosomonas sp. PLL12]
MTQVDQILNHQLPQGVVNSYGIEGAYCFCLEPIDTCELLRSTITEKPEYRNFALRKVCADVELEFLPCHSDLVIQLIVDFKKADYRLRQSLGFVLSQLADVVPTATRRKIQKFFLVSQYVGGHSYRRLNVCSQKPKNFSAGSLFRDMAFNSTLQVTFNPLRTFAVAKTRIASNAPESGRYTH